MATLKLKHMNAGEGPLCRRVGESVVKIADVTCGECCWITTAVLINNLAEVMARLRKLGTVVEVPPPGRAA